MISRIVTVGTIFYLSCLASGCSLLNSDFLLNKLGNQELSVPAPKDNSEESLKRYALDIEKAKVMNEAAYKEGLLQEAKRKRISDSIHKALNMPSNTVGKLSDSFMGRHSTVDVNVN